MQDEVVFLPPIADFSSKSVFVSESDLLQIAAPQGREVFASADGIESATNYSDRGYGNYVMIYHGNGYSTIYTFCDELFVEPGEKVSCGQGIASSGRTGNTTGYALGFGMIHNGEYISSQDIFTRLKRSVSERSDGG